MDQLISGYRRFREGYFQPNRALFDQLAQGQAPKAMVIACCDSRVDPTLIFDASPGEIFTLRNVANLVPPYGPDELCHGTSAAIEFGVRGLGVAHIIVLGHASCGGIQALMGAHDGDFIGPWMRIAEPALEHVQAVAGHLPADRQRRLCEQQTVRISLANLRSFPWIAQPMAEGRLQLHGCYFDIDGGELQMLDEATGEFRAVD
ncbi:MAG TPA: carbonic anhydrase [Rhodospirillaceae bacterium]|nr:carbonic anhydrase [Rhodospirillaceae bacterium]